MGLRPVWARLGTTVVVITTASAALAAPAQAAEPLSNYLYRGTADGDFTTSLRLGPGWSGMTWMGVNDAGGDGWSDLWAVDGGTLKYWGNHGDGKADLLAIRSSDNKLLRWLGTGSGTLGHGTEIGLGWSGWTLAAN